MENHSTIYRRPVSIFGKESGFTLVELMVTIALFGILMASAAGALSYYLAGRSLDTAAAELTTEIREAHALAVSTGSTYRIDFSDAGRTTYTMQKRQGSTWVDVHAARSLSGVEFSSSSLPSFGGNMYLDLDPRGTGEDGNLVLVNRYGNTKTINVNGETVNITVS